MLSLKKILTKILEQLGQSFAFNRTGATISSGDDLNDYITPGIFRSANGTITASLSHTPLTSGGFMLITMYTTSTTAMVQIIFPISLTAGNGIFVRTYRSGTWDAWMKIALTAV